MLNDLTRREFLTTTAQFMAAAGAASLVTPALAGENTGKIKKAVKYHMIKEDLSVMDKFKLLADLGFDGVEPSRGENLDPQEVAMAVEQTGVILHGVVNAANPDLRGAVDMAKSYGASSVLVVAGRVNEKKSYDDNYRETQDWIREAAPYAEEQEIQLLVENVWNNFLLSPLEMARYIDEIDSPAVGVYFDLGNVVRFGWPDQWIQILGDRIKKLDIKEYSRTLQKEEGLWTGFRVKIGDGDVDYPACVKALADIGYEGWATAEVSGGDRNELADIADRMNKSLDL